nr:immunoglobulin heavy chain junction region [Mus musculus]MBK4197257.1 immunoglobulin heavy chain junction region [Mus musculus]
CARGTTPGEAYW